MKIRLTYNDPMFGQLVQLEGIVNSNKLYKVMHWGFAKELVKILEANPTLKLYHLKGWTAERIVENGY